MNSLKSASRSKGFTLIEILVVVAIIGLLAAFIAPKLKDVFTDSTVSTASSLQAQIQRNYDAWVGIGAYHSVTGSQDLTVALLTNFASPSYNSLTTLATTPLTTTVDGDPNAIVEQRLNPPIPGTVRMTFPKGVPAIGTLRGVTGVIYAGTYLVNFTPISTNAGTWSVTVIP
jgi:prepilin-type N-terminal cleavage/methylation domain-containing protein